MNFTTPQRYSELFETGVQDGQGKDHTTLTREDAAERLAELAKQFRHGTVSLNNGELPVSEEIEFKADLDDDELDLKLKWKTDGIRNPEAGKNGRSAACRSEWVRARKQLIPELHCL